MRVGLARNVLRALLGPPRGEPSFHKHFRVVPGGDIRRVVPPRLRTLDYLASDAAVVLQVTSAVPQSPDLLTVRGSGGASLRLSDPPKTFPTCLGLALKRQMMLDQSPMVAGMLISHNLMPPVRKRWQRAADNEIGGEAQPDNREKHNVYSRKCARDQRN